MTAGKDHKYVRVKDGAGNDFICPIDALKDANTATDEELENCVDDATVGRYAGNIDIVNE
ncbi:MAG: hypothetical protein QNI95_03085 [Desulfobacterales bacterium]|nr:hypothetical protein [Desulfobacterales bacterium]